jgi:hypothetical protein
MMNRENAVYGALQRAQGFFDENGIALPSKVDFTTARKRLDDVVASFTTHAVAQDANNRDAKGETNKQQQLRLQLTTDLMRPIAEIARRNLRTTPEFKSLQMPRHVAGAAFLASAKGMLQAASLHKDTLIERGLPADFLDDFQTALTAYEKSVSEREKSRTRRMGATQGLALQEKEGRSVLKVLDGLLSRALRDNPVLLATWQGARAIHRRPGGATPTPATTTPASPTATPASSTPTEAAAA